MSYVELSEAKQYLEVIHSLDDATIQRCIDAAERYAADFMNRAGISDGQFWYSSPDSEEDSEPDSEEKVPGSVVVAVLMLTAEYYENRTQGVVGAGYTKLPHVEAMLHMYRLDIGV